VPHVALREMDVAETQVKNRGNPSGSERLRRLHDAGVSIWLDTLSRDLLASGRFSELIENWAVSGATSNPTIFARAITHSNLYDKELEGLVAGDVDDTREIFFALALEDVRAAADELAPVHRRSAGRDGYVSFECTPDLAEDTDATIAQAEELWRRLDRPNVMIKVPGTPAGIPAIEELTSRGVNVNVTLLFALERYEEAADAYLRGLRARARRGEPFDGIASVASFFLSRIDTEVDALLPRRSPLRGRAAIASARVAHQHYLQRFADSSAWQRLRELGARPQRLLWASTGTKNPAYSDVRYVDELIGPDVVNTMPMQTLEAFAGHGEIAPSLTADPDGARHALSDLEAAGVDLDEVTTALEHDGVASFMESYRELLSCIEDKRAAVLRRAQAR